MLSSSVCNSGSNQPNAIVLDREMAHKLRNLRMFATSLSLSDREVDMEVVERGNVCVAWRFSE